jgi:hypothetical protein
LLSLQSSLSKAQDKNPKDFSDSFIFDISSVCIVLDLILLLTDDVPFLETRQYA